MASEHRVEIKVVVSSGRHSGSTHEYIVYWIGGYAGMQCNPFDSKVAIRKVVLVRIP